MHVGYSKISTISREGWTLIDTLIALLIFSIIASVVFFMISNTSRVIIKNSALFNSNIDSALLEVMINRLLDAGGEGLPKTIQNNQDENADSISLSGYSEQPQSFSESGSKVKLIDGNNDSKNGFGYIVIRTPINILLWSSPRWSIISSAGNSFSVVSSGAYYPLSGDSVAVMNLTDGSSTGKVYKLNSSLNNKVSNASFSGYGLPPLNTGKYVVYTVKGSISTPVVNENPYNRLDMVMTKVGNPAYCNRGTYSLSVIYVNPVDGSRVIIPILQCVAGFKVKFLVKDVTGYGWVDSIKDKSVNFVNSRVRAVAVFLVYQAGKVQPKDVSNSCIASPEVYDINGQKIGVTINFSGYVPDCKRYLWKSVAFIVPIYATKDWF